MNHETMDIEPGLRLRALIGIFVLFIVYRLTFIVSMKNDQGKGLQNFRGMIILTAT
jgi:hypothetical protein